METISRLANVLTVLFALVLFLAAITLSLHFYPDLSTKKSDEGAHTPRLEVWQPPDTSTLPLDEKGKQVRYGRDLIARTSFYLGPNGSVKPISNGMNCQNCHLDAGTKPFGNNYGAVAATYPKFRPRSGKLESIERRVNDCLERSLNGQPLDSLSKEMRAIVAYIEWVGSNVPKGTVAAGSGLVPLKWLSRAANPEAGKKLFQQQCTVCHGQKGEGQRLSAKANFIYPPLWGENSFNTAAGLYRLSNFAKYIRANMPNGATFEKPILTEEEAWDIAAYVVS
ncbi:MAG: c-type cytochrome, partial [Cyclobacteriaceae bacterium]|nr:c-type cytochrome [Cyclobacteriaceae bacterium]